MEGITFPELKDALSKVRRVTGFVRIQVASSRFKNTSLVPESMDFLENLEQIDGRQKYL